MTSQRAKRDEEIFIWRKNRTRQKRTKSMVDFSQSTISTFPTSQIVGRFFELTRGQNPVREFFQSSVELNDYLVDDLSLLPSSSLKTHLFHKSLFGKMKSLLIRKSLIGDFPIRNRSEPKSFLDSLKPMEIYSFVVLSDGRIVFSPVGNGKNFSLYKILGEHQTLSKFSRNVRFAGRFQWIKSRRALMVYGQSDFYRIEQFVTPLFVAFLRRVFPEIEILVKSNSNSSIYS